MLAHALLATLVVALLATPAFTAPDDPTVPSSAQQPFLPWNQVIYRKGDTNAVMNRTLGPFYIPSGQCSGVLDSLLRCPNGNAPQAVEVDAKDYSKYPIVTISEDLQHATVERAMSCLGEAVVTVRIACL